MFNNLIESKPKKQRTTGGLVFSGILHAILGTAAVYGTLQAKEQLEKPKAEKVEFVEMKKKEEPPPPKEVPPPPKDVVMAPPPPKGFQVLAAPVKVPDVLPDIDLNKKVTDEADFSGKGVAGGIAKGVVGGTAPVNATSRTSSSRSRSRSQQIPRFGQSALSRHAPVGERRGRSPRAVRRRHARVATSRAPSRCSSPVTSSSPTAVKNALPSMRFYPAEVGGRKVKQLVQQPFTFSLQKS